MFLSMCDTIFSTMVHYQSQHNVLFKRKVVALLPRIKKQASGNEPLPANKQKGKKICTCCHKEKNVTDYYLSYSPMYSLDERVPVCKECCKKSCLDENGAINQEKFKELLRNIDKPLYYDMLSSAEQSVKKENSYISLDEVKHHGHDILSKYFTLVARRQDRAKSYGDSEKEGFMHQNSNRSKGEKEEIEQEYLSVSNTKSVYEIGNFVATDEIKSLFGYGYDVIEYKKMYDKYEKLKLNYSLQTNLHQEALATYVRFKVKEENATAKGNVEEAKKWYDAAQNAAANGKLTPKQMSASDLQKGMNSVCELVKAVEQATDVIKIMPQFKYRPIDSVDFTIMCYVNYERKLNGQPQVEYEDIYKFYDKKKEEYIKQNGDPYGIFENDPTERNRDTVMTFLKMPDDYDELVGDTNEDDN